MWRYTPHVAGGLAGVGAKVTGVLGDAVAKLTLDEKFQEERQHKSATFGQGLETFGKVLHNIYNTDDHLGHAGTV